MNMTLNHVGTLTLETERLILRKFTLEDAEDMFGNWANDDLVTRYLTWHSHPSLEFTRSVVSHWVNTYVDNQEYNWAIEYKSNGQVIGSIGLVSVDSTRRKCEVGYCLGRKYWGLGIMTEALKAVITFGFEQVGFIRIQACHHADNPASGRVMQKSGLQYEGLLRKYAVNNRGENVDVTLYAILKEDYEKLYQYLLRNNSKVFVDVDLPNNNNEYTSRIMEILANNYNQVNLSIDKSMMMYIKNNSTVIEK
jgi:ribosomal-protein-alanine N-acetyltransferase